jgi:RNA polymerase sigma-B factor
VTHGETAGAGGRVPAPDTPAASAAAPAPGMHADDDTELGDARTPDRERAHELFLRLPSDPSVRDELVATYMPLAEYLARRFRGRGEATDDLTQVAMIGLIKAVDRFDPDREVQFTTYATATVVGELKRHFRDKGWAIRVPRRLQETGLQVGRVVSQLYQDLGRSPTVNEIAERTGLTEEEVLEGMEAVHAYSAVSLDAPTDEDGTTSMQKLGGPDETLETLEGWASITPALRSLPAREQRILYLRFFRGLTQTQIAEEMGMSQMHVSRLLSRTLRQLREAVGPEP